MNMNLFWGIPISLVIGWILAGLISLLLNLLTGYYIPPGAQWILSFGIGVMWYIGGLHLIEVKRRGVVLLLGRRFRMGPRVGNELDDANEPAEGKKKGLLEGWNWLPLFPPLMSVIQEDVREKQVNFSPADIKTADAYVEVDGNLQYWVEDPYAYQSVDKPIPSLQEIVLRAIRVVALRYPSLVFVETDRDQLSTEMKDIIVRDLERQEVNWGIKVGLLTVNNIQLPQVVRAALDQRVAEPIEGEAEQIQAERRVEQARHIKGLGVDANTAYIGSLVDARKPGAQAVNVSGLGDVGRALGGLARSLRIPPKNRGRS